MTSPRLLLLDEPLSSLDLKIRSELRRELRRIQTTLGLTSIYVTHDHSEALALGDRVAVMAAGHVVEHGVPEAIFSRPRTRYVADFLGTDNVLTAEPTGRAAGERTFALADGVTVTVPDDGVAETPAYVGVSPWSVRLNAPEPDGPRWAGEVLAMEYHSGRLLYTVAVPALDMQLTSFAEPEPRPHPGDAVEVSVDWRRAFPLADS